MIPTLLSHRVAATLFLVLITALLSLSALSLRVDPGVESMIPSAGEDLARLREFGKAFGSDEVIVLGVHSESLFSPAGLGALDRLTRATARLPHVAQVLSPTSVRDLDGDELGPFPLVPYEQVLAGKTSSEEFGRRLAAHPLFGGLLVASDARTAAILIEPEGLQEDAADRAELVRRVRNLASRAGGGLLVHVAGLPVEKADVAASVRREQRVFAPLIFAMLAVITAALYRHPVGIVVPLSVVAVSLVWTLGLYGISGRSLNPVTSLITPVVLVVSVAEVIHLMNHHLAGRGEGLPSRAALERAYVRSRVPCFNAAFTTAIGFSSLVILPIPAVREFGFFAAAGVMIAYALTMTLAPLLLDWLPDFPRPVIESFRPGSVERGLTRMVGWIGRHPLTASSGAAAVLALSVLGISRIRVETDLIGALRPTSPLSRATKFIDDHLTGVNSLEILVRGVSPEDPEGLRRVESFEREIRALPGLRKVVGLPDLYARVNRAFHGGDDSFARLPEGSGAAGDLGDFRELLEREAPAELSRFVSAGGDTLRLAARVKALDTASSQRLFRTIREAAGRSGLPRVALTGNFVVLSDMSTSLVRNQVRGLVPALALIFVAMAVQFRSLRLGLVSAIPSGAPVLMVYGLMGWTGIPLSVPTAMIACIAVGMTVDNTIHLLARFREAFASGGDYLAALTRMMESSGRAVVFSTLTVALGFWVGVLSPFRPSVHFAVLTGAALILGLACQGVLLPLSLILFKPLGRAAARREAPGHRAALGLLILAVLGSSGRPAWGGAAPGQVLLRDQFGRPEGVERHRGQVVLLLYGNSASLRRMKSWERRILDNLAEKPQVLRAVDARSVRGRKTEEEVNERLRRNLPPEISVLVDWNGDLARAYAIPDSEVAVTVIDPGGRSCGTTTGAVDHDSLLRVLDTLARIRERGRCP